MPNAFDIAYLAAAAATSPWWLQKRRAGCAERLGHTRPLSPTPHHKPRVLLHAVSVGEVNLCRPLLDRLARHAHPVLSVTTDTGIARARSLYPQGHDVTVVRYPLDFSAAVRRFLDAVRPDAVALAELELWPNFVRACRSRGIPVGVVNGRLSARSFTGYRRARPLLANTFRSLSFAAVQDDVYRERFLAMGTRPDVCRVLGTMKWDAARIVHDVPAAVPGAERLAADMGIDTAAPLVVAGSTAPDEHRLITDAVPAGTQLLIAPRKPEWFDDAAAALGPDAVRRSDAASGSPAAGRFLLDTIGELTAAYALADVAIVGRSFGALFGSDPMEPAALGRPIVIGPAVDDFRGTVDAMLAGDAIVQTDGPGLAAAVRALLDDPARAVALGARARATVAAHQGSAEAHADLLARVLSAGRPVSGAPAPGSAS